MKLLLFSCPLSSTVHMTVRVILLKHKVNRDTQFKFMVYKVFILGPSWFLRCHLSLLSSSSCFTYVGLIDICQCRRSVLAQDLRTCCSPSRYARAPEICSTLDFTMVSVQMSPAHACRRASTPHIPYSSCYFFILLHGVCYYLIMPTSYASPNESVSCIRQHLSLLGPSV